MANGTDRENTRKSPSPWEWLPLAACALLAAAYFLTEAGTPGNRFALFVGLGLVPGSLWRLADRPSWNVHRVFFALGLVAFVLDNPKLRPDAGTLEKAAANWPLVALGFVVSFTQTLWGTLRTHRLLVDAGVDISRLETLRLCLSGAFFNILLPGSTGGDAYRVYAITRGYRTRLAPAIASISLDRFLGLPSLILVVVLGMFLDYRFFLGNRLLSGLIPFIAVAGGLCLALVGYLALAGRSQRLRDGEAGHGLESVGWFRRLHAMVATNVTRPGTLPLALLYGFIAHLACIASCQLFGMALGVEGVPPVRYYLIVPLAMTINAIPGAPGGLGQGELAMATLLDMASPGVGNAQEGVVIMLLFRLTNLAVGLAGGLVYMVGKREGAAVPAPDHLAERYDALRRDPGCPAEPRAGAGEG